MMKFFHNLGYKLKLSNAYKFDKFERLNYSANEDILKIQQKYHSMGGGNPRLQFSKLLEIKDICNKYEVSTVLELGTGSSSVVFENQNLSCLHIEENQEWWDLVAKMINKEKIEYLICNKVSEGKNQFYDFEINKVYDLVYVDGPSLASKSSICFDIFRVKKENLPKLIVVDMRLKTVNSIIQELSEEYDVQLSDVFKRTPKLNFQYHSIFIKKN